MKQEHNLFLKIYIKIRQFFQPYYNYIPRKKNKAKKGDPDAYVGATYKIKNLKFMPEMEDLDIEGQGQKVKPAERKSVALDHTHAKAAQSAPNIEKHLDKDDVSNVKKDQPQAALTRTHYSTHDNKNPKISLSGERIGMQVLSVPGNLDKPLELKTKPKPGAIWAYHDKKRHQVFGHFLPQSGFKHKQRNNEERAKLKSWVRPKNRGEFHRTHLIPFGYHGSESDPRLVIGWDPSQNQNELNSFEQQAKVIGRPIYWHADIRKTQYGAAWRYTIYDVETLKKLDTITLKLDNTIFHWE